MQLADVVADSNNELMPVFAARKDELRSLLTLFHASALKLLEMTSDPLGYDI
jgi:hypothetical protein